MIVSFIIIGILVLIAGMWNACMDTAAITGDYHRSVLSKYSKYAMLKHESWVWKYKNGEPMEGRAFVGSLSIGVAFTDFWHWCQLWQLVSFGAALMIASSVELDWWWSVMWLGGVSVVYGIGHSLLYRNLLLTKHKNRLVQSFKSKVFDIVFEYLILKPFISVWYYVIIRTNAKLWNELNELEIAELSES